MGLDEIRQLADAWDAGMRADWGRSLPFSEATTDRWERAQKLGFGDASSIYNLSCVYGEVEVGAHTWIGPFTILDGSGGLSIGEWCSISSGVHIYSHNTVHWALSRGTISPEREATSVGDACFIGPHSIIAAGVAIGDRCVVGAHTYVNRDLPANSVAMGVPARVVGEVILGDDGPELRFGDGQPDPAAPRLI